ncbi:DUF1793-domain-containing protein [Athelia psychrophila]|uniref:DUF1793-domain-containing protein n=1 Tax=Athelia psychrophila TaxID=1759441 RepID=A0A166VPU5_9AGAM|nr:DUF1793-domain-containing protein [Fibularhizoctonia sp. CBS 109695]
MLAFNLLSIASALSSSAYGYSWKATPFNPASIPLAVRSPYLSAWLPQYNGAALNDVWPEFWAGATLGWVGYVNVDGTVYSWLGAPNTTGTTKANQTSMTFTSTQSTFVLTAGPVDLTVNFLSPVDATDLVKQSLPFSYLAVSAAANDGAAHAVKLYTDISAEWVSGDASLTTNWTTTTGDIITHQAQLESPSIFGEVNDQTQYGTTYYSTSSSNGTTYQTGQDQVVRAQFISNGTLGNTLDTNFRAINDDWPVFGFAKDLGNVTDATDAAVFSIGLVRDPAIQYIIADGVIQDRSLCFWSAYKTVADAISDFLGGYSAALSTANTFDAKVQSDASAISDDYAAIVALSIRQAMGGIELTISKNSDGSWNTNDTLVFLKEISSDGNINTVDVIFPSWPALLYTNPLLGKYLLTGLFAYQATGQYPNAWSAHDLGAHYPNATGENAGTDEAMPVEECGNMLIMTLSYAQKTGDLSLLTTYKSLLDQWTQYLISDSLIPAGQLSTDDFAGVLANQTNLAIKGIVGIGAMAQIANLTGDTATATNYSGIAAKYMTEFQTLASSGADHLTLSYNNDSSWGLTYNMFGDKLLGLNLFPDSLYESQTAWYSTVMTPYGVPLDTRHTYTKSDWQMWTAAIMTNTTVRDEFISGLYHFAQDGASNLPFADWYETSNGTVENIVSTGEIEGFRARPVAGGHLALLLL